jgi:hypothetical protein
MGEEAIKAALALGVEEASVYGVHGLFAFAGDEAYGVGGKVLELGFGEAGFELF